MTFVLQELCGQVSKEKLTNLSKKNSRTFKLIVKFKGLSGLKNDISVFECLRRYENLHMEPRNEDLNQIHTHFPCCPNT